VNALRTAAGRLDARFGARFGGRISGRISGRFSDDQVFGALLAVLALGIGVFLVVPLAPGFVPMHRLPTNVDWHVQGKDQGGVGGFWLVCSAAFLVAIWQWRRGRRPSLKLLVIGALVLHVLALLVPPVHSEDVYAYSFYGAVQHDYGLNPYGAFPDQHPLHPWYPFWSWRDIGPVYGGPFMLLLRGIAVLSGPSLLAWVVWCKLVLVAFELAGIWLLVRVNREEGSAQAPGWPVLLVAWNPMVLQSVPMSAHVDSLLLLAVAAAVLAHRRGRFLAAFLLLAFCFTVKLYMGPLAGLYALWLAAREPGVKARLATIARLGGLGVALTALAYLPYASAGSALVGSIKDVGGHYSSGSLGNIVRRAATVLLETFGSSQTSATAAGDALGRQLALAAVAGWTLWCAWRVLRGREPDPLVLMARWFLVYLLITPWVFYWHEVPLFALVAVNPWGLVGLVSVVLGITLTPASAPSRAFVGSAPGDVRQLVNTLTAFVSRYGLAVVVAVAGLVARRRARGSQAGDAPQAAPRATSRR
jgi:hypothetical protein